MYKNQGSMYLRPPKPRSDKLIITLMTTIILIWAILFLLAGLTLTALGIYLYVNKQMGYPYLDVLSHVFFDLRMLVVLFGALVTLCSLICVLGVGFKRRQLLQIYCYTVILLLLVQFGLALFTFLNKQNLIDILHYECVSLLTSPSSLYTDFFTRLQTKLQCCGCVAPADYSRLHQPALPESCYGTDGEVHKTGCLPTYYQLIDDQSTIHIVIGSVAAAALLFIILVINCYIVMNKERFKEGSENRVTPSPSPSRTSTVNNKVGVFNTKLGKNNVSPGKGGRGVQRILVREHSF
ncbi:hypothetical protein ACHWQZ_G007616 [Mnemiopsis leidyi]